MLNKQKNIVLTHWAGSEERKVLLSPSLSKYIQNYHLLQLRFLYSRYKSEFKGVVLNPTQDMVCPIAISAFLSTIPKLEHPILILSSDFNMKYWRHFLSLIPQANLQLNGSSKEHETKANSLVILLGTSKDLLQAYEKFSIIIIDNIDCFITARTKRAAFNIGITYKNFYKNPNDHLLWKILNWSNIYFVGNYATFTTKYNDFLGNYVEPYSSIFLRITWEYCTSFKKIDLKELQLEMNKNLDITTSDSEEDESKNKKRRKHTRKNAQSYKKITKSCNTTAGSRRKRMVLGNQKFLDEKSKIRDLFETPDINNKLEKASKIQMTFLDTNFDPFEVCDVDNYSSVAQKDTTKSDGSSTSYAIPNQKKSESKGTIKYADCFDLSIPNPDDLLSISDEIIKKDSSSQSSDDDIFNNSVLSKIIDSPIKSPAQSNLLELFENENSENSNILSQIFDVPEKRTYKTSVLDNLLDSEMNKVR